MKISLETMIQQCFMCAGTCVWQKQVGARLCVCVRACLFLCLSSGDRVYKLV